MVRPSLNLLVQKLDPAVHQALEEAAWLCRKQTHYDVELEHLFMKLVTREDGGIIRILKHYDIDAAHVERDLAAGIDRLRRGNTRDHPGISPHVTAVLQAAWEHASLELNRQSIGEASVLYAALTERNASEVLRDVVRDFARIDTDSLRKVIPDLLADDQADESVGSVAGETPDRKRGTALDRFTFDLTGRARDEKLDPVLCRDREIRGMIDVLMRRRQNNPILTGEAGVGKTAIVEGLAQRIAEGDVPPPLQDVEVRNLDLALLQAGAGVRGEFESRVKSILDEIKHSPVPIILFIDEAHTMIGAGGAPGQGDAANLLKPALARGELRTIAATTWGEYKKYFEKDQALTRRFQVISVDEPDEERAFRMMLGLAGAMEKHHDVFILPEAVRASVRLSRRYIPGRHLPDKSVSLLDTAAARVAVERDATPAPLEDARRRIESLAVEKRVLERETAAGHDHADRLSIIDKELCALAGRG